MSLTDKVNGLPTSNAGANVLKKQVLSLVRDAVNVEFDPAQHPGLDPDTLGDADRLAFEVLDTCHNLLREYAVRVTLASLRSQFAKMGFELPSDEEILRATREAEGKEGVASYLELVPSVRPAMISLRASFRMLVEAVENEAAASLGMEFQGE